MDECVHWARLKFEEYFHNSIAQLLFNFPPDQVCSRFIIILFKFMMLLLSIFPVDDALIIIYSFMIFYLVHVHIWSVPVCVSYPILLSVTIFSLEESSTAPSPIPR